MSKRHKKDRLKKETEQEKEKNTNSRALGKRRQGPKKTQCALPGDEGNPRGVTRKSFAIWGKERDHALYVDQREKKNSVDGKGC